MWRRGEPEPVETLVLDLANIPKFAEETGEDLTRLLNAYGRAVQQDKVLYVYIPKQRKHKE